MVIRHRRRWRTPSAWFLALVPWLFIAPVLLLTRVWGHVQGDVWRVWAMVILGGVYTLFMIMLWKPWKKED